MLRLNLFIADGSTIDQEVLAGDCLRDGINFGHLLVRRRTREVRSLDLPAVAGFTLHDGDGSRLHEW